MSINIVVECQKDCFSDEEILEIKKNTESFCLIEFHQKNSKMLAAFDDIIGTISVYIDNEFWKQLFANLANVGIGSAISMALVQIKKALQKKTRKKVTTNEITEKPPTIAIATKNVNIILPVDVSDDKFQYCIEKAFESVKDSKHLIQKTATITIYDKEHNRIATYSTEEYYWTVVNPCQKDV